MACDATHHATHHATCDVTHYVTCDLFHDPVCDPIQSNPAFLNARNHSVPFPPLFLKTLSKECFDRLKNISYC